MLHTVAKQNITYHCKNSVAFYDAINKTHRKGLKLLGWNDVEFTPRGNQKLRYSVFEDECKVRRKNKIIVNLYSFKLYIRNTS